MDLENIEILIPTYNEEKNLPITIDGLKKLGFKNITILDGLSDDNTISVAKNNNCKILVDPNKRMGFGYSIINGINKSSGKYLCIFDADGSFDPLSLLKMIKAMEDENLDFVFGSRSLGGNVSDDDTLVTKIGNYFFSKLISILFNFETSDALFLYLLGKKECFLRLNLQEKDFKICTETLIKARIYFKCKEIYSHEKKRIFGDTKVNRFVDGFYLLKNIIEMRLIKSKRDINEKK